MDMKIILKVENSISILMISSRKSIFTHLINVDANLEGLTTQDHAIERLGGLALIFTFVILFIYFLFFLILVTLI